MTYSILFTALGLVFIVEGVMPFLSPYFWRQWVMQVASQPDRVLRTIGFFSMVLGLALVLIGHQLY